MGQESGGRRQSVFVANLNHFLQTDHWRETCAFTIRRCLTVNQSLSEILCVRHTIPSKEIHAPHPKQVRD